jgi:hypothetical protein
MIELKRQKMVERVSEEDIDRLLEQYYEGLTSVEEESLLKTWLSQPDTPARFDADKAMFGYFAGQKSKPVKKINVLRFAAWSSAAAAVLALLLVTGNAINKDTDNYVFIQGKKYTNLTLAKKEAQSTLSLLLDEQDEVSKSSSLLNEGDKLIQEQLDLLGGFEL